MVGQQQVRVPGVPPDSGHARTKPGLGTALDGFLRHLPGMAAPDLPRCLALCGRGVSIGNLSVSKSFPDCVPNLAASKNSDLPAKKDVAELARMTERFTYLFHSRYFPKQ